MPNWCSNYLTVEAAEDKINQVYELFKALQQEEERTNNGQMPEFLSLTDGYFFEIYLDEGNKSVIQYETSWSPNIDTVQAIAEKLNFDFVLEYEELGNMLFGKYEFKNNELLHFYVTDEQSQEIEFDEDNDIYKFRGEEKESEREFLETLLEESIKYNHHL